MEKLSNHSELMHTPHDAFFKYSLQQMDIARDFFRHNLPTDILKVIDLETLEPQVDSFVDKKGHQHFSDMVYRTRIRGRSGYLFCLLEHQSKPDRWMALRMQTYLMQFFNKQVNQKCQKLPNVFCCVFYHGQQAYPYSRDLFELFEDPVWAKNYLLQPFHLVDVSQTSDEEILQHGQSATLELLQKHIRSRDIGIAVRKLIESGCLQMMAVKHGNLIDLVIKYILKRGESPDQRRVIDEISDALPDNQEVIMTIAQALRQEGVQEGMQQGRQQGRQEGRQEGRQQGRQEGKMQERRKIALKLLRIGQSIAAITDITGLSAEAVKELHTAEAE